MAQSRLSRIDRILLRLWEEEGTDVILTVGAPPLFRINGELIPADDTPPLAPLETESLLAEVLLVAGRESLGDQRELDFSFTWQDQSRVRGNAYRQRGSVSLALRMIPYEIPTYEELGIPASVRRLAGLRRGLILVTGPTGGGKSTTLATLIDDINSNRRCHIITIEDPIEYVHRHKLSAVDQREVGQDTESFATALRNAMREDPDVILVGEMRDLESIRFALTIAETGHLVLATLHTNDVAQALDRIVDVFPPEQQPQIRVQLSNTLSGICYQQLVPRTGGGMVAAHEVLVCNNAVRNLIREGKTNQLRNTLVTGQAEGMQTLEMSLNGLVQDGTIAFEQALAVSLFPKEIKRPPVAGPNGAPAQSTARSGRVSVV